MQKLTIGALALGVLLVGACSEDDTTPNTTSGSGGTSSSGGVNGLGGASGTPSGGMGRVPPSAGAGAGGLASGGAAGSIASGSCDDVIVGPPPPTDACANTTVLGVYAATDADLEALRGVSVIDGDLRLGMEVTNLEPLGCLTRVNGSIRFDETGVTDLHGLENLAEVGADIVFDAGSLESVAGLEGLQKIGGKLAFGVEHYAGVGFQYRSPSALANLCGLRNLKSLGSLLIANNIVLPDFSGLERITQLSSLVLYQMWGLQSMHGLESLRRIYGESSLRTGQEPRDVPAGLVVDDAPELVTLDELAKLEELTSLNISFNTGLRDMRGIGNASGVFAFYVTHNDVLETCQIEEVLSQLQARGDIQAPHIASNAECSGEGGSGGVSSGGTGGR